MIDKDTNEYNEIQRHLGYDFLIKDNMILFSFSQLSSKKKIIISDNNSFNLKFLTKNNLKIQKNKKNAEVNNRKICLIDGNNNNSLKTLNIDVPSSERLLQSNFQKEFMKNYDNSFAHFCGINKFNFQELYINNRYVPVLNKFGDINISIKSIIDILNTFSFSLEMKIHRRYKKNRINKIFKTFKNKSKKKNKNIFEIKNSTKNNEIIKTDGKENFNLKENNHNLNDEFGINKINKMDNLKKRLKITINPNRQNLKVEPTNLKSEIEFNKQNNFFKNTSFDPQNIFNSENKTRKEFLNKKRINTSYFNSNINTNNNTNINLNNYNINNIINNNQLLSPFILSPNNILSPSFQYSYSNISSPNLFNYSPYYNGIFDRFTFNNINRNAFTFGTNSPSQVIINNNINPAYKNLINNNIINNNIINNCNINNKNENILNGNNLNDINKSMNIINQNPTKNLFQK